MRVVALLAFRNEARVLARTLAHLAAQGVDVCLIDNGSTDESLAVARRFLVEDGGPVFRLETLPFAGSFHMPELMAYKERLAREIDADWFLHQDADEIREPPAPWATLREGLAAVDAQGFNAVDFREFVFLPTADGGESFEGRDFVALMRHYYYFAPQPQHRVNAWKNTGAPVDLHTHWGHRVEFVGRRVAPGPFVLRHYMALSRAHALGKYGGRIHSAPDIAHRGWADPRVNFQPDKLRLPKIEQLKTLGAPGGWDTSDPWPAHRFIGAAPLKTKLPPVTDDAGQPAPVSVEAGPPAPKPSRWPGWLSLGRKVAQPAPAPVPAATTRQADQPSAGTGHPPMPIIVGAARSGTTLLRLMLDSHPHLAIPPETHFLPALRALQTRPELKGAAGADAACAEFIRTVTGSLNWAECGLTEDTLRAAVAPKPERPFGVSGAVRRFYRLYAEARGKTRWGDKTPPYVTRLRDVAALLPEARFIHLIRDGRDVALSVRGLWFDAGRGNLEDQAANWLWRVREARQQAAFCAHYIEVRYEDLLESPRATLERVCAFSGLEYDPALEAYHETAAARLQGELRDRHDAAGRVTVSREQRAAIFEKVGQPPDRERAGRWRREMTADERVRFEAVAGGLLRELGYPAE